MLQWSRQAGKRKGCLDTEALEGCFNLFPLRIGKSYSSSALDDGCDPPHDNVCDAPAEVQEPSPDDFAKEIFQLADFTESGRLSSQQVVQIFRILGSGIQDEEVLQEISGRTHISSEDFLLILQQLSSKSAFPMVSREILEKLRVLQHSFRRMGADSNGEVSNTNLRPVFRELGKEDTLGQLLALLDKDGSGSVSWLEFAEAMIEDGRKQLKRRRLHSLAVASTSISAETELSILNNLQEHHEELNQQAQEAIAELSFYERFALNKMEGRYRRLQSLRSNAEEDDDGQAYEMQHRRSTRAAWKTIFISCIAGVVSAVIVSETANAVGYAIQPQDIAGWALLYSITGTISTVVSCLELCFLYVACVRGAMEISDACRLVLWPMDRDRAIAAGAIVRAALELPHPALKRLGVDPNRIDRGFCLTLWLLLFFWARRVMSKFLFKLIVRKALPRAGIKLSGQAEADEDRTLNFTLDIIMAIVANVIWNYLTVRQNMREVQVCCQGPTLIRHAVTSSLQVYAAVQPDGRIVALPDPVKILMLRAAGTAVARQHSLHPNVRLLLTYLESVMVDDQLLLRASGTLESDFKPRRSSTTSLTEQASQVALNLSKKIPGVSSLFKMALASPQLDSTNQMHDRLKVLCLDDSDLFLEGLAKINDDSQADLVLSILALALVVNGKSSYSDFCFLQDALYACSPPRLGNRRNFMWLVELMLTGRTISGNDLIEAVKHEGETLLTWKDWFNLNVRRFLDFVNCA
eukprot:TRINITY_DN106108_c0_g1_i1.p1 TRINITY_DN106108_c0_g1~~TRINITY_DN106108_c0_g1_i1.p1  ORF type:complete len:750 (+),score=93.68 TRINITY_DN106108_c0_g1_i1:20-2269(+)